MTNQTNCHEGRSLKTRLMTKPRKKMKKAVILFAVMMLSALAVAQTQQGYVKTKGRMVNGQLVHGHGLKGATVSIKGRTTVLVNTDDGAFSFPVPEAQFRLDSVRKKGYQLVDMDALGKTYKHSSNPLYLVMETPKQQLHDKVEAERKIRKNLQRQLQDKEEEIENLKAQQKISDEEYHKALQKLYEETNQNEQLVKDMAKRYSEIDYDQLDEFYRKVSYCIENGELVKADSLLRTRGDIHRQVSDILQRGQVLQDEKQQLQKAEAVQEADIEEAAQRCYSYYEAFAAQHLNDSAAYYLELRASLDTTNAEWQALTAQFFSEYIADYNKALSYLQIALRHTIEQFGELDYRTCAIYGSIGAVYLRHSDYDKAIEYLNMSLPVMKPVSKEENLAAAIAYGNTGGFYYNQGDYDNAIEYYDKALIIVISVFGEDYPDLATIYNNIGLVYANQFNFDKALEYFYKALSITKPVFGETHYAIASSYNNIGGVYHSQEDNGKALEFYNKALPILKSVLGEKHPDVAICYNNIGAVYGSIGDFKNALECNKNSLAIRESVFGEAHPETAASYNNIANIYAYQGDYDKAGEYYHKALKIFKSSYGENHPNIAACYNCIGIMYAYQEEYESALEYHNKALQILKSNFEENHPIIATIYTQIGSEYSNQGDYDTALEYHNKALNIMKSVFGEDHPKTVSQQTSIAYLLYDKALKENSVKSFCEDHCFTVTVVSGDTPASQQGMSGEYILLEFGDWNQESTTSINDKIKELQGKRKTVLVMKNGIISQHRFKNMMGALIGIKYIGKEEKKPINEAYEEWKKQNRK